MLEFVLMLVGATVVFGFLLAVFFMRERSKEAPGHLHSCAQCSCDRENDSQRSGEGNRAERCPDHATENR